MLTKLLNDLIEFFYRHRIITILTIVAIIGGGVWAHAVLDTEAYPEFTPPTVRVITLMPGKGAEEVERLVTIPLEKELNAIPKEMHLRSVSILGLSVISIVFEDDSNQLQNRQMVLERISQADIPDDAKPSLDPDSGGTGEIYRYTLESKFFSPMSRRAMEDWQLERTFKQIPGVIDVVSFGGPTKTFQVNIDARKLVSFGIPLTSVFQALQNSNATTGGNYIENNGRAYVVRGLGLLNNVQDLERVVVSSTQDGVPVRIKDIAQVDIGGGVRLGQFGKNDDDDAIMGIVLMRRGANASKVVERLYKKLPEIRASLPDGVKLEKLYDRQELVDHTLETVFHNLFEGVALVVVVLIVFLFDLTSGLIASIAIPLSLCVAFLLLHTFHISANLLSLGAIDFGIIVDGAVVMVENAFARLSQLPDSATRKQRSDLVLDCAKQVGTPILFAITIIMAAFLPIFSFEGVAGKLFRPLVFTMNFNLVGALVSALFIIPTLIGIFIAQRKLSHNESPVIKLAHFFYKPILGWSIKYTGMIMIGALLCLALTGFLASRLGSEFLPALDEGNIWLRTTVLPTSVSLEESVKIARRLRRIIMDKVPEIKNVTSQTGCPDDGTDPNLFSNIELFLDLKPAAEWRPSLHRSKAELIALINKEVSVVPNALFCFSQYIQDNVDEAVAGAKGTLAIKIFGPDVDELQKLGDQVSQIASTIPGFVDVANNQQLGQPQYQVAIDRDEASRYGVNVSDVQNVIETAVGGKVATRLIDGEKRFPVLLRFSKEYRNTEKALDNILIDPPGPITSVPLSQMASIKYGYGAAFITRENNSRVMIVRVNVRGRDLGSAVKEAQQKIGSMVKLPAGYQMVWAGQYEFQQEANQRLLFIVPVTMLLIYLILLAMFRSHKNAFLIMCSVPLAALGGVSALLLTNTYFSISAAVGFIALSGVAVQNGVILISHVNLLRKEGLSVADAAYKGALDRMRPVLMTATVAMLGLVPAATSNGIGAQSQKPFAIVIIGGLLTATVLTLIVLPALYTIIEGRSKKDDKMNSAESSEASDAPEYSEYSESAPPATGLTHIIVPLLLVGVLSSFLIGCTPDGKAPAGADTAANKSGDKTVVTDSTTKKDSSARQSANGPLLVDLTGGQEKEIGLTVIEVKTGTVLKTVESPGRVGPDSELSRLVSTPSAGRAVEVKARLGDVVKEGQVMAIIKSDPIGQLQSDLLQATLQSKADISTQQVQLKLSHITFDRETKLFAEQVSAKADLQAAENQLEKDEGNLASLKAKLDATIRVGQERLTLFGAPPDSARKVISQGKIDPYIIIKAPESGLVIERTINPGEMNDGTKQLFTITDLSQVWLFADIFEKDIREVTKGDQAVVTIDSLPGKKFPAHIIWVGDSISATTRTLPVRATVANADGLLRPGMFARMVIDAARIPVLLVPHTAVIQKGDITFVFIEKKPGVYEERDITTGIDGENGVQVTSGLKAGDRIVSTGGTALLGTAMKASEGSDN